MVAMKDKSALYAGEPPSAQARCGTNPAHRLLVIDDDIGVRQICVQVLISAGYRVDAAEDGAAGWEALHANSYDLLITDNNMPKVSGVDLVKKLRCARMSLPVILTSGAMPATAGLQLAATLLKPFSGRELLGTVEKVLCATDSAREQFEPLPIWQSQPLADGLRPS